MYRGTHSQGASCNWINCYTHHGCWDYVWGSFTIPLFGSSFWFYERKLQSFSVKVMFNLPFWFSWAEEKEVAEAIEIQIEWLYMWTKEVEMVSEILTLSIVFYPLLSCLWIMIDLLSSLAAIMLLQLWSFPNLIMKTGKQEL